MKELMSLENLKEFIKTKKFRKRLKQSMTGKHERLKLVVRMISEMYNTKLLVEDIPLELTHYLSHALDVGSIHYCEDRERELMANALLPYFNVDATVELIPTLIKDDELHFKHVTPTDVTHFDETPFDESELVDSSEQWNRVREIDECNIVFARESDPAVEIIVKLPVAKKQLTNLDFVLKRGMVANIDQTCFSRKFRFLDVTDLSKEIEFTLYYRHCDERFEVVAFLDDNHEVVEPERFKELAVAIPITYTGSIKFDLITYFSDKYEQNQRHELEAAAVIELATGKTTLDIPAGSTYSEYSDFMILTRFIAADFDFENELTVEDEVAVRRALENMSVKEFLDHMAKNYPENGTADAPDLF